MHNNIVSTKWHAVLHSALKKRCKTFIKWKWWCVEHPVLMTQELQLQIQQKNTNYAQMSFICHIHNYTEYNEEWNVFSVFNPSIWSSGQPTLQRPGSSWGFSALLKSLTSVVDREQKCSNSFECADEVRHIHLYILEVVDTSCQSRDSNPQPWVSSPTLYPLGHDCPRAWVFCHI